MGQEDRESEGEKHIHSFLQVTRKVDIRKAHFLDIESEHIGGKKYHGNYTAAKNKEKCIYLLIETPDRIVVSPGIQERIGNKLQIFDFDEKFISLSKEGKIQEALKLLEKDNPKRFLSQGANVERR